VPGRLGRIPNGTRGRSEDDELCIAVDYFPLVIHALSQCFLDAARLRHKGDVGYGRAIPLVTAECENSLAHPAVDISSRTRAIPVGLTPMDPQ
jgi:hypothetical protein